MYIPGPTPLGDVGFSLRRPRWLRKLRPKKWKPKTFLKVAAGATILPLVVTGATGAGLSTLARIGKKAAPKTLPLLKKSGVVGVLATGGAAAALGINKRELESMPTGQLVQKALQETAPGGSMLLASSGEAENGAPSKSSVLLPLAVVGLVLLLAKRK